MRFQLVARTGHPDFLDLPWDEPLSEWQSPRLISLPTGIHRHVVRTVDYDGTVYVIKELPARYAKREYRFLRHLAEEGVPVVAAVGVVTNRSDVSGDTLEAALITQHLAYSLPYRLLFQRWDAEALREPMVDALVGLLVRIHLVGFLWGDCSLSNTLFRRDAGGLAAYLVDSETGELHEELTDGQRRADIDGAIERCAGELMDLQAAGLLRADVEPVQLGEDLDRRYTELWCELTKDEVFAPDERHRIHDRLRRINELGYDVEELVLEGEGDAVRLHLATRVVEPGRHRRRLRELTGLDVQDKQAWRLLNDIDSFQAWLEQRDGRTYPQKVAAARWVEMSFDPALEAVPQELRGKREPAEIFHEILDHWHHLSEIEGQDLDFHDAARSYVDTVLRFQPDERAATEGFEDELEATDEWEPTDDED